MTVNLSKFLFSLTLGLFLSGNLCVVGMDTDESLINSLPPEILETTLSLIEQGDQAQAIRHLIELRSVCKQWHEALSDESIACITGINKYNHEQLLGLIVTIIEYDDPLALQVCARTVLPSLYAATDDASCSLHAAAVYFSPACMQWLLEHGADPNSNYDGRINTLHLLCCDKKTFSEKSLLCTQHLLSYHADINIVTPPDSVAPLHRAVAADIFPLVKLLLENNADFTLEDNNGFSSLMLAERSESILIKALFDLALHKPPTLDDCSYSQLITAIFEAYMYDAFDVLIPLCTQKMTEILNPEIHRFFSSQQLGHHPLLINALEHPTEPKSYFTYLVFLDLDAQSYTTRSTYLSTMYEKCVQRKQYIYAQHILNLVANVPVLTPEHTKKIITFSAENSDCFTTIVCSSEFDQFLHSCLEHDCNTDKWLDILLCLTENSNLCTLLPACTQKIGSTLTQIKNFYPCSYFDSYGHKILQAAIKYNNHVIIKLMLQHNIKPKKVIEAYCASIASTTPGYPTQNALFKKFFQGNCLPQKLKNYCLYQAIQHKLPGECLTFLVQNGAAVDKVIRKYGISAHSRELLISLLPKSYTPKKQELESPTYTAYTNGDILETIDNQTASSVSTEKPSIHSNTLAKLVQPWFASRPYLYATAVTVGLYAVSYFIGYFLYDTFFNAPNS